MATLFNETWAKRMLAQEPFDNWSNEELEEEIRRLGEVRESIDSLVFKMTMRLLANHEKETGIRND